MKKSRKEIKKEKRPFLETVGKRFEIDTDVMRGLGRVEIRGRRRVEVSGVKSIKSYADTRVQLQLAKDTLTVMGRRLECVFYRGDDVAVEGQIDAVNFEGE